jgi:membrane protease YdiL (CAAX protease family)
MGTTREKMDRIDTTLVDTTKEPPSDKQGSSRYTGHPWRSLLVILGIQGVCYYLGMFVLSSLLDTPINLMDDEALPSVLLATLSSIVAYLLAPFFMRIPSGKCTFAGYLDDIRLTRVRPLFRLLILTLSCMLILILCQGTGSIVYRLTEGEPVTSNFLRGVFDLSQALPPESNLLFIMFFSSILQEVAFRGILLTMLLKKHTVRRAILYSALAFGAAHLPAVFAGREIVLTLGQVAWAFLFGLFYAYIFVKTGSLLPCMIIHWLSNVFQAPLTSYWTTASPAVSALFGVVFGYGLAAILMIAWVRFFCNRWMPTHE